MSGDSGARHDRVSIKDDTFFAMPINLPSAHEQEHIASFLERIDQRIEKQRALVESLKKYKRGVMRAIFRGKAILFSETTKWKSVRLGDECTFFSGGTPRSTDSSFYGGEIPFIRSGEIHGAKTELFLTDDGLKYSSAKLVSKGDLIVALYGATHEKILWKNKICYIALFISSIALTLYIGCATATVTLAVLFIATIVPFQKIRMLLLNEKFAVTALIMSALVVFVMGQILKNEFINNIVFGYFNRSYTVTGRLEIYNDYLLNIIRSRFWFGYGYSNSMMKNMTGLYANAQNGLLEIMVNMGFLSVVSLIVTVFWSFKNTLKTDKSFYISIIVYGMIIASIFEVALNWFFFLGVCLIRWNCDADGSIRSSD